MAKISLDLTASAASLLDETGLGVEGLKELAAQGKVTQQSLKEDFNAAGKSTKEFNSAIDTTVKALASEGKTVEALILKYGSAQKAQRAMAKELSDMAVSGQRGTREFNELSKAAAHLKDTIDDTRGEIKKLSSDTKVLDQVAEGGRAMAAGFSVAAGASALLGEENADMQKSIQKAQGAMALLLGVQEIATIATTKGGIATGIATAAQSAYAFVVGTSSGALRVFRLALAATGIGLIVLALAELVIHWDDLTEAIGLSNKELEGFTKLRKEAADSVVQEAGKVGLLIEQYKNSNTSQKERKKIIEELKEQSPAYFGLLDTEKATVNDLTAAYGKYVQALILKATAEGIAKKVAQNNIDSITTQVDELTTFQKALATITAIYSPATAATFKAQKGTENYVEQVKKGREENVQLTKSLQNIISQMDKLGGDPTEKATKAVKELTKKIKEQFEAINSIKLGSVDDIIEEFFHTTGTKAATAAAIAFGKAGIPPSAQIELLRGMGFNDKAVFSALSEAADAAFKGGDAIAKVPVEAIIIPPKDPTISVLGFKFKIKAQNGDSIISQEDADKITNATKQVTDVALKEMNDAFNLSIKTQQDFIDKLDEKIAKQKEVVANEKKLAQDGATNSLQLETDKLDKLNAARDKALAKQKSIQVAQLAIDTATQLSALATAAAQVFQAYAPIVGGTAIAAGLVALMFGAFAAAKITAAVAISKSDGFYEGGYTGDGDPTEVSTARGNRGYKYHKKEFVANEQMTADGRDFLEGWHKGDKRRMLSGLADLLSNTGVVLPDENLPAKLFSAKETHDQINRDENNYELKQLRNELVEIKEELLDWKDRPREETISHGDSLIKKTGNRTVITKRK